MLGSQTNWEIPEETVRVAQAAFPKGNPYMTLRDELGVLYQDSEFAHLYVWRGRPAESPGFLAMVTVMQFAEGLTDRQTAAAVCGRIDWKYTLGLELTYAGFAHSVLSEFRQRLVEGRVEMQLLNGMLAHLEAQGWVKARGRQRTDSTYVLALVRQLNRLELIGETMRNVLNDLASVAPEWLKTQVAPDWFDLYGSRFESYRLPKEKNERHELQQQMGKDGVHLLRAIYQEEAFDWLIQLPSVQILRQVWMQQFYFEDEQVHIRSEKQFGLPSNKQLIQSPYDPEARNRTKRKQNWTGYSVHFTETCDEDTPNLITHVTTTPATTGDVEMTGEIHEALAEKGLLPNEHYVDTGYVDSEHLVDSAELGLDLVGPAPPDPSWQAKAEEGFDITAFSIDWETQQVWCPQGKVSRYWRQRRDAQAKDTIEVFFDRTDCLSCQARQQCTKSKSGPRTLRLRPQAQFIALQQARQRQETEAFIHRYNRRAGVEGTISQAVRSFDLRRSRYIGLAKTHLRHIIIAVAVNLTRIAARLADIPKATTRQSRFSALQFDC